ncbi:MAG: hypothetical protein RBS43_00815 [Candidatus Cloacimonas sp.]|nr:hypothetical protein [Candidatus Cloacimonas sp.]
MNDRSFGTEYIDYDLSRLEHKSLYRISDTIYTRKDEIETYLCPQERDIFNVQYSICLNHRTCTFRKTSVPQFPKPTLKATKNRNMHIPEGQAYYCR